MVTMQLKKSTCLYFLVILAMLATIHGFVIDDTCTTNGQICQSDQDCCSNWCIFEGHFWACTCKATSNCNGNCPSGICRSCQCPTTKNIVDLDAFCTSESGWNSKCCKCLINRLSAGNLNFERFRTNNEVGVLPIDLNTFFYSPCNLITSKPCDSQANKQCAQIIYKQTNSWTYWESDAKACGC